jgi:hypothetical protein
MASRARYAAAIAAAETSAGAGPAIGLDFILYDIDRSNGSSLLKL